MHPHHLNQANLQIKDESLKKFSSARKMGGEALSVKYLQELEEEINELFTSYQKHNESKNIFAFSRTATSLVAVMFITYLTSGILEWFWLGSLSFLLNFFFWSCFVLLGAWVYVKFSGEYAEVGEYIDGLADLLWQRIYQPLYERFIQHAIRAMLSYAAIQDSSAAGTAIKAKKRQ